MLGLLIAAWESCLSCIAAVIPIMVTENRAKVVAVAGGKGVATFIPFILLLSVADQKVGRLCDTCSLPAHLEKLH